VPTFLGKEAYLDKFIKILERAIKTENTNFIIMLKEEIELLEEIIQIRNLQQLNVV
jgi:tRNA G46 methylase TrmB